VTTRSIPEDGDIVVREEHREGMLVYVLHVAPGPDHCLHRTRDEAVAYAIMCATRDCVRAWLTDEGYDFVLLVDFRVMGVQTTEVS
jgi:hypothetical protein